MDPNPNSKVARAKAEFLADWAKIGGKPEEGELIAEYFFVDPKAGVPAGGPPTP